MIHSLQTGLLHVDINDFGAELSSIFSKKTKTEYLWQGDPKHWEQRAPVLFPIVGRLKDGKYTYNGKEYNMSIHGFAAGTQFTTEGQIGDSIMFTMEDTKETRAIYPFSFTFSVIFTLQWNVLETIYEVTNKSDGTMYFNFGSHEGYRCPWGEGEAFDDYFLEFDRDSDYTILKGSENNLMTDETECIIKNGRRLQLNYDLFANDSLPFANIPSGKVILGSNKSIPKIEINYGDAPNLVIWTRKGAPYVCIEPWYGMPDYEGTDGDLTKKRGIISLKKGGTFNWTHQITIYE